MSHQEFWNKKFSVDGYLYGEHPNQFIEESAHLIPRNGRVLCLGEGEGRNAVFLAGAGFEPTALDGSDLALQKAQELAERAKVSIATIHMDLNHWQPDADVYDSVVSSYCHLPSAMRPAVFGGVIHTLKPGGYFIAEFFSLDQLGYGSGGPKDTDLLYTLAEFEAFFQNQSVTVFKLAKQIVHLDEGIGHRGDGSVIRIIVQKREG